MTDTYSFDVSSHMSILAASQKDVETNASLEIVKRQSLKWWEKVIGFYKAPITKFWGNVVSLLMLVWLSINTQIKYHFYIDYIDWHNLFCDIIWLMIISNNIYGCIMLHWSLLVTTSISINDYTDQ